ncbi:MAG: hypothetical protein AUK35_03855 [Zetaproteobacteria bacterium CG2_30_46_52]|nr:MAG: hypothetical protein AUK35_03855 [Zetaproteobacteria bacterium CG2_30_46_52]
MTTKYPDFLIVGAAKAGTSALFRILGQHPSVFIPQNKEPNFFAFDGSIPKYAGIHDAETIVRNSICDPNEYYGLFRDCKSHQVTGEASTLYLYDKTAPSRIKETLPNVKIIIVLRNPVERALSAYNHLRRDLREDSESFEEALEKEHLRIQQRWEHLWHYKAVGEYYDQLLRYKNLFPDNKLLIINYDDFLSSPDMIIKDVCEFIGVDSSVSLDVGQKYNQSGTLKSHFLHKLINHPNLLKKGLKLITSKKSRKFVSLKLKNWNTAPKPSRVTNISDDYKHLSRYYLEDIVNIEKITGLDLSAWKIQE